MGCYHKMLPVVFLFLLGFVHSWKGNPLPGELFVACPFNEDVTKTNLRVFGSKKGDDTDLRQILLCNWPEGSQGKPDCRTSFNATILHLGKRRVDLSVPIDFFCKNSSTFECHLSTKSPCAVFFPDEISGTTSVRCDDDEKTSPEKDAKDITVHVVIFVILGVTIAVLVLLSFFYCRFRHATMETRNTNRAAGCKPNEDEKEEGATETLTGSSSGNRDQPVHPDIHNALNGMSEFLSVEGALSEM